MVTVDQERELNKPNAELCKSFIVVCIVSISCVLTIPSMYFFCFTGSRYRVVVDIYCNLLCTGTKITIRGPFVPQLYKQKTTTEKQRSLMMNFTDGDRGSYLNFCCADTTLANYKARSESFHFIFGANFEAAM